MPLIFILNLNRILKNGGLSMLVYCITNLLNNKKYVGATQRSIMKRYSTNWCLRLISNNELRNDIKKYGQSKFELKVLKKYLSKEAMLRGERLYIKKLNTIFPNGYNFQVGKSVHDHTKKKISETMKKSYLPHRGVFKKLLKTPCVVCGTEVVSYLCRGKPKQTCSEECFKKVASEKMKHRMAKKKRPVIAINKTDNSRLYFDGIVDAAKFGFEPKNISLVINTNRSHGGYRWRG